MMQKASIPDAVVFLSPATSLHSLPPELEDKARSLRDLIRGLRCEGFTRLRVVSLDDDKGQHFSSSLAHSVLNKISQEDVPKGFSVIYETAGCLEDWLNTQTTDWTVRRPDLAPRDPSDFTGNHLDRKHTERYGVGASGTDSDRE